ncbi:hypothetical protein [Bradyrhizobium ivorense]|nr:hypothetical protein [Bradyrhizobium ivorense]
MISAFASMAPASDAMWRLFLFFLITFVIFAGVVGGLLYTADQWIPIVTTRLGKAEETNKLLVVLPAAIATLLAALTSGVSALMQTGAQRAMNRELATQKAAIDEDLDRKRNTLLEQLDNKKTDNMKALEDHKTLLAKELDEHRDEISRKRAELGEEIEYLKEARDTATYYRFFVGQLRVGAYSGRETKAYHAKLVIARDRLPRESDLYLEWCAFMQWGRLLEENAGKRKTTGQVEVWEEPIPEHGDLELGVIFADSGERVLALIEEAIAHLRTTR